MSSVIIQRLDLALKLMDTTTGFSVSDRMVRFIANGEEIRFNRRGEDCFVLINHGRENMSLKIMVDGYETRNVEIDYEALDKNCPMKVIFLIPSENSYLRDNLLTLKGRIEGLRSISLIEKGRSIAHTDTYDSKRRIMTLFEKGYRLKMDGSSYGVLNADNVGFYVLSIEKQPTENTIVVSNMTDDGFRRNAPIFRIVEGYVEPDGFYRITLRDDGANKNSLIRIDTGEVRFAEVDFHSLEGVTL